MTVVGAVLLAVGLGFFGYLLSLIGAPALAGGQKPTGGFVALAAIVPIALAVVLGIGIVRLRWQRAYFRRHWVLPKIIGQKSHG